MTSPEKAAANRENARKSTGPRTPGGKSRSSRNATTHGLTANPGDPTDAYRERLAEWVGDLRPRNILERTLAERACRATWSLGRCDRYEDATAAKRNRDAAERHHLDETAKAEAIGRRLLAMPEVDEGRAAVGYARPGEEDPAALVGELGTTSEGVAWLLSRWAELARALAEPSGWDGPQRHAVARLMGMTEESARNHPVIGRLLPQAIDLAHPPGGGSWLGEPRMRGALDAAIEAADKGLGDAKDLWLMCLEAVAKRARGECDGR